VPPDEPSAVAPPAAADGANRPAPGRRLLYVSSCRDRAYVKGPIRDFCFREDRFYGSMSLIHYHLENLGWEIRHAGMRESLTPFPLARMLTRFNPTIVFTYGGLTSLQPVLARKLLTRWRGPIVHGWADYYDEIWAANFGLLAGLAMRVIERQVIRRSDYILSLGHYCDERARRWGKRSWYIPNGSDVPGFDPSTCPIRLTGDLNLVYTGDQAPYKRTLDVVGAMSRLPSNIKLYLTGQPYPYLRKYASENVIFLGFLSRNDLWSVISQADVCVCTADQDCNGKFHDYLRMRKPILAYDGKPNWLFTNRVNALLARDYEAAILELYRSPELRRSLAENAARDIPVYTWKEIAQMYDRVFREILALYWDATV
jgi:glycosyltransferase involved in cell wall biosynthesis